MAIIHVMTNDAIAFPVTAWCPFVWINNKPCCLVNVDLPASQMPIVTYLSHVGLCIAHYTMQVDKHTTHAYMLVWNPRYKVAESILLQPGFGFYTDAPKEVLEAHDKYLERKRRRNIVIARWEARKLAMRKAHECRVSRFQLRKLRQAVHFGTYQRLLGLLQVTQFRSPFRAGLARDVRQWLADPHPKYSKPLSAAQLQHL